MRTRPETDSSQQAPPCAGRACPVCGSGGARFLMRVPAERLRATQEVTAEYSYYRCGSCETAFIDPLPSEDELRVYYESDDYHFLRPPGHGAGTGLGALRRLQLRLARPIPAGAHGKHLDYGCGTGDYLAFSRSHGLEPMGVEFSEASARAARDRGFLVVLAHDLGALPHASFSYVSAIHALEHAPAPADTFLRLARLLAPGGTLFVEVPYLDGHEFWAFGRYYSMIQAPLHLQFFSDRTMDRLARGAGLRLVRASDNLWTPVFYVWSFLNVLDAKCGLRISRRAKNRLSALAFPVVWLPAALASLAGMRGVARRYYFTPATRQPDAGRCP